MFEALGYRNIGNGLLIFDGPICVDRVAAVSKDCLVAYVECQVLSIFFIISFYQYVLFRFLKPFGKKYQISIKYHG